MNGNSHPLRKASLLGVQFLYGLGNQNINKIHVAKGSRVFALDRLFSICYRCYWDLIPEGFLLFSPNNCPYAPLLILYFTVTDFGVGREVCISFYISFSISWISLSNLEL